MTSKPPPTESFVYIALPGASELVTAARFELTDRSGIPLSLREAELTQATAVTTSIGTKSTTPGPKCRRSPCATDLRMAS
jgi:hypothetical protein